MDDPVIGLVVPSTGGGTVDAPRFETAVPNNGQEDSLGNGPAVSVGRAGSSPAPSTSGKPKSLKREVVTDARWLSNEVATLALEIERLASLPKETLPHVRKRAEMDARARMGLCKRTMAGIERHMGWV
jgi:hypothetical protein